MSQYEALKYVSFPTQVVAKSCKMVPVMLMGYLVSRKRYTALEYAMAVAITSGAAIFKLNEEADPEQARLAHNPTPTPHPNSTSTSNPNP